MISFGMNGNIREFRIFEIFCWHLNQFLILDLLLIKTLFLTFSWHSFIQNSLVFSLAYFHSITTWIRLELIVYAAAKYSEWNITKTVDTKKWLVPIFNNFTRDHDARYLFCESLKGKHPVIIQDKIFQIVTHLSSTFV